MEVASLETNNLKQIRTYSGSSLYDLSYDSPILLVFLRHFGCTFCREAMADLRERKAEIRAMGASIVLVHLSDDETAKDYFEKYGLSDVEFITDPEAKHYAEFGLLKGSFNQLFGLKTWMRTIESTVVKRHGGSKPIGDGFQMPGVFMLHEGRIKERFVHKYISDRPDYADLVGCCVVRPQA